MATSPETITLTRKPVTKNYGLGILVNVTLAIIAYLIGNALAIYFLKFNLAGTTIGLLSSALSLVYFGRGGLREIPISHRAVPLSFGTRQEEYELSEGWVWNWPAPIRSVEIVDVREQTLEVGMTEVLTDDNVPISIDLSAQFMVVNLYTFLSAKGVPEALREAIDSTTRVIIQELESDKVAQEKKNIPDQILNGFKTLEDKEVDGIANYAAIRWGIEVIKIRITHIRLPEELETANTAIKVQEALTKKEVVQAATEKVEAAHVAAMIKTYVDAGLSATEAVNALQAERSKATRIIIDGNANPLVQAGLLAGNKVFDPAQQLAPINQPTANPKGSRRRQGKE